MKHFLIFSFILILPSLSVFCQNLTDSDNTIKLITPLKNNTYDIKEFTKDSLLIYKGTLSSVDPEVRNGNFYFFNNKGEIIVTGKYKMDVPYGIWVYYNESHDTIKTINYTSVWELMEKDTSAFTVDPTMLKKLKKNEKVSLNPDGTFFTVSKKPTYKNADPFIQFNKYINENLVYPVYAARKQISGYFEVKFVIDSMGRIRKPVIPSSCISSDLGIEAIRILYEAPAWEPGYIQDFPVNVAYSWPFLFSNYKSFSLNPGILREEGAIDSTENEEVFFTVEQMPSFNGGDPYFEFRKYIAKNLHYPEEAAENGISGRVITQFVINSEGKLIKPTVIVSAGPLLDQEALRLLNSCPLWKPGYQRGEPVNVLFTFPFNFVIQ